MAATGESSGAVLTAMRSRLQELQHAVGARDEFIATVAHELRNPVSPLMFQFRLAIEKTEQMAVTGEPVPSEWVQSQLRRIEQRLHRLLETLDRLLDVSRLSTGRIDLQPEPMNLARTVRDVIGTFEAELAVARCKLTITERGQADGLMGSGAAGADLPQPDVQCDSVRGGTTDRRRGRRRSGFRHGRGAGSRGRHCAASARADLRAVRARAEQRSGGFGIGLWVVRSICVAMGGTISVESELGEGACFTVMLPRRTEREPVERHIGGKLGEREPRPSERGRLGCRAWIAFSKADCWCPAFTSCRDRPARARRSSPTRCASTTPRPGGTRVYVTLLAESHSRMFAHLRRMAFFDETRDPGPRLLHRRL